MGLIRTIRGWISGALPLLGVFVIIGGLIWLIASRWVDDTATSRDSQMPEGVTTVVLAAERDYQAPDASTVRQVPDAEALAIFPTLKEGFDDLSFSIEADADIAGTSIEKTSMVSDGRHQVVNEYPLEGIRVATTYQQRQTDSVQNRSLDGGEGSLSVKQTIAVKNDRDEDRTVSLTVRTKITADTVVWNGREYRISPERQVFRAYEKTASIPDFAKDSGQKDLPGVENFANYTHTYTVGAELSFMTAEGKEARYDWSAALMFAPEVSVYREGEAAYIELRLRRVAVPAYGETVIDPDYDLASTANYTARYDGNVMDSSLDTILIGDVNGDGLGDLVVSVPYADNNSRIDSGSVYVIFRKADSSGGQRHFDVAADYNIRYDGAAEGDQIGSNLTTGDVNGNGLGDLVFSAPYADNNSRTDSGSIYVFFSTLIDDVTTTGNNKDLATGTNYNIRYDGAVAYDYAGSNLTTGDVNGNGLGDLVFSAPYADNNSRTYSGSIYVFFSTLIDDVTTTGNNKDLATGTNYNIRYDGAVAYDYAGSNLTTGDVNGNGLGDLILGVEYADNNSRTDSGSIYVLYSTLIDDVTTTGNNKDLATGTNYNIRYDGAVAYDYAGSNLTTGDVNGNGLGDLILGVEYADNNSRTDSGSIYVLYSTLIDDVTTTGNNKDLATGTNYNIRYDGAAEGDQIGSNLTTGDVNGDGLGDLILGVEYADNNSRDISGSIYVFFSTLIDDVTTTGNNKDLATGTNYNIRYDGAAEYDDAGLNLTTGDVNGDGLGDLVFSAPYTDNNSRTDSGSVYVFFSTLIDDVTTTGNNKDLATGTNYNIRYDGAAEGDQIGSNLTTGDVNGDVSGDLVMWTVDVFYGIYSTRIDDVGTSTGNTVDLATSTNSSVLYTEPVGQETRYVSYPLAIGDVNGDGQGDLVIGNPSYAGVYVILGGSLKTGVRSVAVAENYNIHYLGNLSSRVAIGDVNGDSLGDLMLYDSYGSSGEGYVYVIFSTLLDDVGSTTGNDLDLYVADTNYNIRYSGATDYGLASRGIVVGDVNGDGLGDLTMGASSADYNSRTDSGSIYVFFSTLIDDVTTTGNNKDLATGTNYNIRYDGAVAGQEVSYWEPPVIGDVNSDGLSDLIISVPLASYNSRTESGSVYVLYSTLIDDVTTTGNNKDLATGTNYNIRYDGAGSFHYLGCSSQESLGDVNGDGLSDMVFGATDANYNSRTNSGSAYVLFSTLIDDVTTTGNNKDLATGTNYNIRYDGAVAYDFITHQDSMAIGDVNSDGLGDLVFSTPYADNNSRTDSGSVYVFFSTLIDDVGVSTGNNKDLATGTNYNIRYDGAVAGHLLGLDGLLTIHDADGDGWGDFLLGSSHADYNSRTDSGSVWILSSTLIDDVGSTTGNNKDLASGSSYTNRYDGAKTSDHLGRENENLTEFALGDVTEDGVSDLVLIGESISIENGGTGGGSIYVIENVSSGGGTRKAQKIQGQAKFNGFIKMGH